jgi:hypothetical protein
MLSALAWSLTWRLEQLSGLVKELFLRLFKAEISLRGLFLVLLAVAYPRALQTLYQVNWEELLQLERLQRAEWGQICLLV